MKRDDNSINRVMRANGLGTLDDPASLAAMASRVQDHQHFTELLRACKPEDDEGNNLRREMYEAMAPHLRFQAKPLEDYVIAAKEYAAAAQLPVMDAEGKLHPYQKAFAGPQIATPAEHEEFTVTCRRCGRGVHFINEPKHLAIKNLRDSGWAYDELGNWHLCPECLEKTN